MKLLVIEDDPRLLATLCGALREERYAVDGASDGREGLHKAQEGGYDAVVLDVMLPGLDGWSVLGQLRKTQAVPVLMLTARDTSADRVRGLDAGADDYLVKPFDLPELFARLRALIRRAAGKAQPLIEVGGVVIDVAAKVVKKDGQTVSLTAREYAMLEYLALHRGEVVTRTELYEHIFDEHADTLSNLLDVHLVSLRRKLGRELIATRRGLGFCLE